MSTLRTTSGLSIHTITVPGLENVLQISRRDLTGQGLVDETIELPGNSGDDEGQGGNAVNFFSWKSVVPIIEIKAAGPAEGRTQLLYLIAANMLLGIPPSLDGSRKSDLTNLKCRGHVVWIDCSCRFDIHRLHNLMLYQASQHLETPLAENLRPTTDTALSNLHVFRPNTSAELLATVRGLDTYFQGLQYQAGGDLAVQGVILGDLTSFYWEDRQREEDERAGASSRLVAAEHRDPDLTNAASGVIPEAHEPKRKMPFALVPYHSSLAMSLLRICSLFSCPLLLSAISFHPIVPTQHVSTSSASFLHPTLRSLLPAPWLRHINIEVIVRKERSKSRIPKDLITEHATSLETKEAMEQDRKETRATAWIDARKWVAASSPVTLEQDKLDRLARNNFHIAIDDTGVRFDSCNGLTK